MQSKKSLKLTMAVAVSWGLFVGASITCYANEEDPTLLPDIKPDSGEETSQALDQHEENKETSDALLVSQLDNITMVPEQTAPDAATLLENQNSQAEDTASKEDANQTLQPVSLDESGDEKQEEYKRITIAVMSDVHYLGEDQKPEGSEELIEAASISELRLIEEVEATVDVALKQVVETKPDVLLYMR